MFLIWRLKLNTVKHQTSVPFSYRGMDYKVAMVTGLQGADIHCYC